MTASVTTSRFGWLDCKLHVSAQIFTFLTPKGKSPVAIVFFSVKATN